MIALALLFCAGRLWADVTDAETRGSAISFWLSPQGDANFHFPPEANLNLSPWQTPFEWSGTRLRLGDRAYDDEDSRFPPTGCRTVEAPSSFPNGTMQFCANPEARAHEPSDLGSGRASLAVNGEKSPPSGFLALSHHQLLLFEARWASGKRLRFSLIAPPETAIDLQPRSAGGWRWREAEEPFEPRASDFAAPSFPWGPVLRSTDFDHVPAAFRRKGLDDIVWTRVLRDAARAPAKRVRLRAGPSIAAYSDEVQFSTEENGAVREWRAHLPTTGAHILQIRTNSGLWRTTAWRLRPGEVSGRLSAFLQDRNEILLTGEGTLLRYFDDPFASPSLDRWQTHRWGLRLRGYGSLATFQGLQSKTAPPVEFLSAEARMLVTPGAWNLDDVWGFLLSRDRFRQFSSVSDSLGAGFFWGRPMPEGFDRWLRHLPWFRFPKYVDLDLTALRPLEGGASDMSWIANFHGKMFLNEDWFFEMGVGFYQLRASTDTSLNAVLGTIGIGLMF